MRGTILSISSAILLSLSASAQTTGRAVNAPAQAVAAADVNHSEPRKVQMNLKIGTRSFTATLENSSSVRALQAMLPLKLKMAELNGNEKYARLPAALPTNASNPGEVQIGDLMLYGSDTLVLFYKSFPTSYRYTRLGRLDAPTGLAAAVGSEDIEIICESK